MLLASVMFSVVSIKGGPDWVRNRASLRRITEEEAWQKCKICTNEEKKYKMLNNIVIICIVSSEDIAINWWSMRTFVVIKTLVKLIYFNQGFSALFFHKTWKMLFFCQEHCSWHFALQYHSSWLSVAKSGCRKSKWTKFYLPCLYRRKVKWMNCKNGQANIDTTTSNGRWDCYSSVIV